MNHKRKDGREDHAPTEAKKRRSINSPDIADNGSQNDTDYVMNDSPVRKVNKQARLTDIICIDSDAEVELNGNPVKRVRKQDENRKMQAGDIGIIESVELKNFMCHARLDFKFGSNVNFIVGQNGSGKSAVMTAIVVGLGGTAHNTNRGSSLANFIMSGKQTADVSISLRNCGLDAYKPEEYGSRITIERRIARTGRNHYRLRGDTGSVVSEKRDELVAVLDQFNIQVDNPVCILNQDASRNFLNSKNPKSKYQLFLKATQLDQMNQDYEFAKSKQEVAAKMIDQKALWLPTLEKEVTDWRRKHELQESMDGLRGKATRLRILIAWAEFGNLEKELKSDEDALDAIRQRTPKLVEMVEKYKKENASAQEKRGEIQANLQNVLSEIERQENDILEKKNEFTLKRQLQKNARLEWQKVLIAIKSAKKDHDSLEKRIQDHSNTDTNQQMAEKQERLQKIASLEEKRLDTVTKCATTEHHCDQLKSCNARFKDDLNSVESEERRLRSEISAKQRKLEDLVGSRTNHLLRFGNYVPHLMQKIEQTHRQGLFRQKPIGPLGAHVKLRDARYSVCVEACIKGLLFAYCCDNHADHRQLEKLFKEVMGRGQRTPTVIVSKFANSVHDISQKRVYSNTYPCVLDVLDIDDLVVTNCLIDQRGVESILLIENNTEARRVMQREVPRNCREAYTGSGDQLYPAPNFRYYSGRNERGGMLQENVEALITSLQDSIKVQDHDWKSKTQRISEISREKASNANEIKVQEQELSRMRQMIQVTRREIEVLQNVVETETIGLNILEVDLKNLAEQLANLNEDAARTKANFERLKAEADDLEATCKVMQHELKVITSDKYDPLKDSLEQHEGVIDQVASHLQHYSVELQQQQEAEKTQEKTFLAKSEEVEEWRTKCTEDFGPCETSRHPLPKLKEQFNIIQKRLVYNEETHGDPIEIQRMYLETSAKYKRIKGDIDDLNAFLTRLHKVMIEREISYAHRREYIALRVTQVFTCTLELKKFKGNLLFDHDKESLIVFVETSQAVDGDNEKKTSVQGLSGGERSFATVSFMLALWEAINSPFRMMDEFDIFMDMVTRRVSMDMIRDFASTKGADSQFIILTPLDMTKLTASDTLRIFKMIDPDRCQAVLPFESAADEPLSNGRNDGEDDDDS